MVKRWLFSPLAILLLLSAAPAQSCNPEDNTSLDYLKSAVRRVVKDHLRTGWDDKAFDRAGDMAALAIIQTISDRELTSPDILREALSILREAFGCPSVCVKEAQNRRPVVTMLLLEHLHNATTGPLQAEIEETHKRIAEVISKQK